MPEWLLLFTLTENTSFLGRGPITLTASILVENCMSTLLDLMYTLNCKIGYEIITMQDAGKKENICLCSHSLFET